MCDERPLLITILQASCCEFTTLEQDDQDDQGADNMEFTNKVGQHTLTTSLQHNQNWRTKTVVGSWQNIFTLHSLHIHIL